MRCSLFLPGPAATIRRAICDQVCPLGVFDVGYGVAEPHDLSLPAFASRAFLSGVNSHHVGYRAEGLRHLSPPLANASTNSPRSGPPRGAVSRRASRDDIVTGLPAFGSARSALGSVPMVREWYGSEPEWGLLALKFIYGFLGNLPEPTFDPGIFEDTWAVFWAEVSEPEWTWIALANLRNFRSGPGSPAPFSWLRGIRLAFYP